METIFLASTIVSMLVVFGIDVSHKRREFLSKHNGNFENS
jgi:hypothetical protein